MMIKTEGSVTSQGDGYTREDVLFTYSDDEREKHKLDELNAGLFLNPKFIPVYPSLLRAGLSLVEGVLYGFIDFFLSNNDKFYCSDEQIAEMLNCGEATVSRGLKRLKELGLIKITHKVKGGGGKIRFVQLGDINMMLTKHQIDCSEASNGLGIYNKIIENKNISLSTKVDNDSEAELKPQNDVDDFLKNLPAVQEKKEKSSAKKERKDITELILTLKAHCAFKHVIYDNEDERMFAKQILDAKHFGEVSEGLGMTRTEFAVAVLEESINSRFWKGYCTGPKKIYNSYVEIVNRFIANSNKQSSAVLDDL